MARTTCFVCLISTVRDHHKNALRRASTSSVHITKPKQSTFLRYLCIRLMENLNLPPPPTHRDWSIFIERACVIKMLALLHNVYSLNFHSTFVNHICYSIKQPSLQAMSNDLAHAMPWQCMFALSLYTMISMIYA